MKKEDIKIVARVFAIRFINPKEQWENAKDFVMVNWLYFLHEKYDAGLINLNEYVALSKVTDKLGNYIV